MLIKNIQTALEPADQNISVRGESIGDRLRIVQERLGIKTDSQFAKFCKVSRSTMSEYLNGKQIPRPQVLQRIAKLSGVDPIWLREGAAASAINPALINFFSSEIFDGAALNAPVNYNLLVLGVAACRETFEGHPKPTLREVLQWIAVHTYTLHSRLPDLRFRIIPDED